MSCNCGHLLRCGRMKCCSVSYSGDLLDRFIEASKGNVDGEKFFDRDFLGVGININPYKGKIDEVTNEIKKFHDAKMVVYK